MNRHLLLVALGILLQGATSQSATMRCGSKLVNVERLRSSRAGPGAD